MTILFFTRLFYPHIGGVEKHVLEIGKRFIQRGHKVVVVTEELLEDEYKDSPYRLTKSIAGIDIHRIPLTNHGWKKKFVIWKWLWKSRRLIEKADVIHAHDVFFWYFPFKYLYAHKPCYVTFHGYEGVYPPSKRAVVIRKLSEWMVWGSICVGDYIKKWYQANPDYVLYGGVNEKEEERTVEKNEKKKIIFVGRLEKDMGILVYTQVIKQLRLDGVSVAFEACGDGVYKQYVSEFGKTYGYVRDIRSHIQNADVIFASSYLSIMEALYCGKPIFSVYENSLKEDYLRMSPFSSYIVIENSSRRIADQVEEYLTEPKKFEDNIKNGYAFIKTQTWDSVVDTYEKLWKI